MTTQADPSATVRPPRLHMAILAILMLVLGLLSSFSGFYEGTQWPLNRFWAPHGNLVWLVLDIGVTLVPGILSMMAAGLCLFCMFRPLQRDKTVRAVGVIIGTPVLLWVMLASLTVGAALWPPVIYQSAILGLSFYALIHFPLLPLAQLAFVDTGMRLIMSAITAVASVHFGHWFIHWFYYISNRPSLWTFWVYLACSLACIWLAHRVRAATQVLTR